MPEDEEKIDHICENAEKQSELFVKGKEMLPLTELDIDFIEEITSGLPEGDFVAPPKPPPLPMEAEVNVGGYELLENPDKFIRRRLNDPRRPGATVDTDLYVYPISALNASQLDIFPQHLVDTIRLFESFPFIAVRFDPEWIEGWDYSQPFMMQFTLLRDHGKAAEFLNELTLKCNQLQEEGFEPIEFNNLSLIKINELKAEHPRYKDSLGDSSELAKVFKSELALDPELEGIDPVIEDLFVLNIDFTKKVKLKSGLTRKKTFIFQKLLELLDGLHRLQYASKDFTDITFDDDGDAIR